MIFLAKKFVLSMIIRSFAASVPTKPLNDAQMRGAFFGPYFVALGMQVRSLADGPLYCQSC